MNADATSGVAIAGDVGAEFPALPWLAGGLLIAGAAVAAGASAVAGGADAGGVAAGALGPVLVSLPFASALAGAGPFAPLCAGLLRAAGGFRGWAGRGPVPLMRRPPSRPNAAADASVAISTLNPVGSTKPSGLFMQ